MRIVLIALGVYLAIIAVIFLLGPVVVSAVLQTPRYDPLLTTLYGQVVLVTAVMAWLIASDPAKHEFIIWALVINELGHAIIFVAGLGSGAASLGQVGAPLIVAIAFLVLLIALLLPRRKTEPGAA